MKKYKFIEEEPSRGRRGSVKEFLDELERELPGRWVRYPKTIKQPSYFSLLANDPEWSGLSYRSRSNGDGTVTVWVKMEPEDSAELTTTMSKDDLIVALTPKPWEEPSLDAMKNRRPLSENA
jgi:hypothetical protein